MKLKTLKDAIENLKNETEKGITFIGDGTDAADKGFSYGEIYRDALGLLTQLQERGFKVKDEVMFQVDDNKTFVTLFWACLLGGMVPAPVTVGNTDEHRLKVFRIWEKLSRPHLMIAQKNRDRLAAYAAENNLEESFADIDDHTVLLEDLDSSRRDGQTAQVAESDIAYIQFSSGSTGDPKGVVLTHKNLLTNIKAIAKAFDGPEKGETYLSWMPLTHDMGIIIYHMLPMVKDWNQCLMPSTLFIRRPLLWLEKLSQYKAAVSASPNFGYKHVLKFFKQDKCSHMDLSSVRLILNGAEPISAEVCADFSSTLAPLGLKKNVVISGYGLAEASVGVTVSRPSHPIRAINLLRKHLKPGEPVIEKEKGGSDTVSFVDVGTAIDDCRVKIADESGSDVGDDIVGRILIKGDNVTSGYYRDPEATGAIISADGWLDTGDLGFKRNDHLVITGRAKDIIFVNGQNYYSHDLERLAEELEDVEGGKVAAAGVFNPQTGQDDILIFLVFRKKELREFADIANEVKKYIATHTGLTITHVVPVKRIPRTTSGKLRRFELARKFRKGKYDDRLIQLKQIFDTRLQQALLKNETPVSGYNRTTIITLLSEKLSETLGYITVDLDGSFFEMGLGSLQTIQLQKTLSDIFRIDLPASLALDYPTINKLADYLDGRLNPRGATGRSAKSADTPGGTAPRDNTPKDNTSKNNSPVSIPVAGTGAVGTTDDPIAVIGMGCRFPGEADTPAQFWENLTNGVCSITEVPGHRWNMDNYTGSGPESRGKISSKYGGFIKGIDQFDASFFKISPIEARGMDPQQRLLLEVTWEALENSGLNIPGLEGSRTGVFVGMCSTDYLRLCRESGSQESYAISGSMLATASGRISYIFGFQGPNFSIDTACSSSLVAVHQAVRALRNGECNMALAGGVNILLAPENSVGLSAFNVMAEDGKCKTFDASADGYGRAEGCGMVVLKRLSDAQRDNDPILALVAGSAVNHDGKSSGLTVPSAVAQEQLIGDALRDAGVEPAAVDYIEAHGTGTKLGDPQEVHALSNAFAEKTETDEKLLIGSVKTNIGHLESAAGVAGLMKVILALQNERIPRHLHFENPNPLIPWQRIPISVTDKAQAWPKSEKTRMAGVSAFGFGGTNAHVVVREAPACPVPVCPPATEEQELPGVFSVSVRRAEDLRQLVKGYREYLSHTGDSAADICYTSNMSRSLLDKRFAVTGSSKEELLEEITKAFRNHKGAHGKTKKNPKLMFLFSGQGTQYAGMGRELYDTCRPFKEAIDACDELFAGYLDKSILRLLYGADAGDEELRQTGYAQPVIFSIQYALVRLWESYGVKPSLVFGHSIGQFAAAVCAGVLSLDDAVRLTAHRGRLMQSLPAGGAMAAVAADEETVRSLIQHDGDVSIAAVNGPRSLTVSGPETSLRQIETKMKEKNIKFHWLNVSHAFHSPLMGPILEEFGEIAAGVVFREAAIPIIPGLSCVETGTGALEQPDYWVDHIAQAVRFYDAVKEAHDEGVELFVEIGGKASLSGLMMEAVADEEVAALPSLRKDKNRRQLMDTLAQLYSRGVEIDWPQVNPVMKKVVLPNYPFRKDSYWLPDRPAEAGERLTLSERVVPAPPTLGDVEHKAAGNKEITVTPVNKKTHSEASVNNRLKEFIAGVSGMKPGDVPDDSELHSLGLDSLMIAQLRKKLLDEFGVDVSIASFFAEVNTPLKIAGFLVEQLPADAGEVQVPAKVREEQVPPKAVEEVEDVELNIPRGHSSMEKIMALQIETLKQQARDMTQLMEKQLEVLRSNH